MAKSFGKHFQDGIPFIYVGADAVLSMMLTFAVALGADNVYADTACVVDMCCCSRCW